MTPSAGRVRVLVADDHNLVRQGLVSLLVDSGECEVVAEAADGLEAVAQAHATHPEVAVIDLTMPRLSGLEAVRRIHAELPRVRILVASGFEDGILIDGGIERWIKDGYKTVLTLAGAPRGAGTGPAEPPTEPTPPPPLR